ncbi:MAG: 3'-5' exonuclease, partial [Vicinamibacterales bacterium]
HVSLLLRRFLHIGAAVTRLYVEALAARGVPHLLVGGKSFHGREEVETVRAALAAVEWPDDELSVFAALRGALFALDDEMLLEYRDRQKVFHPFRRLQDPAADLRPVVDALALLAHLHSRRNYRPVADTLTELLNATRAHVGFVLRPAGEQALANVLHIAELARQYETNGGMSFRGFVEELRDQADGGQAAEAPILEEGAEGVRLMTAHKAKGLEFPVVVLADMTAKLRNERADRLIDKARNACYLRLGRWTPVELAVNEALEVARDEAEGVRVAYVAATRARDLLVVPVVGDVEWEGGWTSPLNGAVYPALFARRTPVEAPHLPAFKKDSVFRRPDDEPFTSQTVQPGLHLFDGEGAAYQVIWWDPHALNLGAEASLGLRRESLIVKDVAPSVVDDGMRDYRRWSTSREAAVASGASPRLKVQTVTEWAAGTPGDQALPPGTTIAGSAGEPPVQGDLFAEPAPPSSSAETAGIEVLDLRGGGHPGGARFGELVHGVLASVPLDANRETLAAATETHARILGAPDLEREQAVDVVARVLGHQLLERAAAAFERGNARRETPVTLTDAGGGLVEGVVDLAFVDEGRWHVLDFKTDREISQAGEERYRRQVALYASAIAKATGIPARGYLVRV